MPRSATTVVPTLTGDSAEAGHDDGDDLGHLGDSSARLCYSTIRIRGSEDDDHYSHHQQASLPSSTFSSQAWCFSLFFLLPSSINALLIELTSSYFTQPSTCSSLSTLSLLPSRPPSRLTVSSPRSQEPTVLRCLVSQLPMALPATAPPSKLHPHHTVLYCTNM